MSDDAAFRDLVRRFRAGDEAAAAELEREYKAEILRAARLRLKDLHLRRLFDSVDIWQSVVGNFFVRATAGQFELDTPEQLIKLLAKMANNKIRDHSRRHHAARRDSRRRYAGHVDSLELPARGTETPSQIVCRRELIEKVRGCLDDEERYLRDQRALGRSWSKLAAELGLNAEALRKKLERALDRVARQLGLEASSQ
jgi:RNA polymerase sigma-70 factor (ECF subfamily)